MGGTGIDRKTLLRVVIAGGGFCGTMTLVHLIRHSKLNSHFILITKGTPPCGIAYRTYSDQHLLNVEARNMSAFPEMPGHFVEWCERQKKINISGNEIPTTFFPRNTYGKYLEEIFSGTLKSLPSHLHVEIIDDEVTDITDTENTMVVHTGGKRNFSADKVVLATGNCEPGLPLYYESSLIGSNLYFPNPWNENAVVGLSSDDSVLIIGTGLTMVDVVIGLTEKKFTGKIIALSPHGFNILPHRKVPPQRYILDELTPPYDLEKLFRLFYKHIRQARIHGQTGETVVDAIRAKTQEIWQGLSPGDKKKFMSHLRHLWGVARHRIPAHVYRVMQELIHDKKLEVIAGRIKGIKETDNCIETSIILRKDLSEKKLIVARTINCTGPETDIRRQKTALYKNLLANEIVFSDEMNLGIDADSSGRIFDKNKNPSNRLFTLGSLLKGKLWESTAIPELRLQAENVAKLILEK